MNNIPPSFRRLSIGLPAVLPALAAASVAQAALPGEIEDVVSIPLSIWIVAAAILLLTGITLIVISNRRLRRENHFREMAEKRLRENEQRLHALSSMSSDWFWKQDEQFRFTEFSCTDGSGFIPLSQSLGNTRWSLSADPGADIWARHRATLEAHQAFTQFEYAAVNEDGGTIWYSINGAPRFDDNGRFIGYHGTGRNITERKLIEQELIDARHAAEKASQVKSRFLAAASHDLRQPIQAIRLFSDALSRSDLNETQRAILSQLFSSANNLGNTLDTLLDLSRLDSGLVKPTPVPIEAGKLLDMLGADFKAMATDKGLQLALRTPARELILLTDPGMVSSLIGNLVSNAIKYTRRGRVLVGIRQRGEHALIQVWDTGIGIAAEHIDSIFEEYFQIGNPERDKGKGLGLGLSIVSRLARLLDTRVICHSVPARGSVFEFRLPLLGQASGRMEGSLHALPEAPPGERIVVVEDNPLVSAALKLSLSTLGMQVSVFASGEEALAATDIDRCDIFVSDYRLKGMSGPVFLDTVARRRKTPIRALLLTGDTTTPHAELSAKTRWPVLFKPVDLPRLLAAISAKTHTH